MRKGKQSMFLLRMKQLKTIILLSLFSCVSFFLPQRKYWVICERGIDARDNGWHFYHYLKEHHPEIVVFYIIDKKSPDYEKVKKDAVQYGSVKNYWIVANANKLISTHVAKFTPNLGGKVWKISRLEKKFHFLQHGVIFNYIDFLHRKNVKVQSFFCGAKPERDFIVENFGHAENVVHYTGLARYDGLHDAPQKKQILLMPTWRTYICTKEDFLKSDYFREWQALLSSERLISLLEKNEFDLIFYPHYEFQKYLDCFDSINCRIKVAPFNEYDVQMLLKESKLLITDFSSVFFDFGYMRKPIIYFHFDAEKFFSGSHEKGYFDHEKDGFGKVCVSKEEVLNEIDNCFNSEFRIDPCYIQRIEKFFPLYDKSNCQRIFEKIIGS